MRIGVDFDNTIVCYDVIFHRVAVERGLVPAALDASKEQVREHLRRAGREAEWTEMQGHVYGSRMAEVGAYPGALACFAAWSRAEVPVAIISHKTRHPYRGERHDLHQAARDWLELNGFFDPQRIGMSSGQVYLELTKEEKLRRIADVHCTHFIDDLPELLAEPGFPARVQRILFDPHDAHPDNPRWERCVSWADIQRLLPGVAVPTAERQS
ncbi:MAG: hypothetical protein K2R98_01720 [Gemmataceae bacterium]|nr:hypothetical protein [Gemmataceae bacterium]